MPKRVDSQPARARIITTAEAQQRVPHLLRRSVQIFVAVFFEQMAAYDVTPVQYAALVTINDHPGLDQRTLGSIACIDRSTIGGALRLLENKGLVTRVTPAHNQRIKQLYLTTAGRKLLVDSRTEIDRVQARMLAPLRNAEQRMLTTLLTKIVLAGQPATAASAKRSAESEIV
jgi:MarR family transcriptional regulator, lower aerobic nicotinate degradation pathway regulator